MKSSKVSVTFGCESSLKIIDSLSEVLCWILKTINSCMSSVSWTFPLSRHPHPPSYVLNTLTSTCQAFQDFLSPQSKCQFLSLLGHLHNTIRIVPQGEPSCYSAASASSLHDHITLDKAWKMKLKLLHHFFSSWNSIHQARGHPPVHRCSPFHWLQWLSRQQVVLNRWAACICKSHTSLCLQFPSLDVLTFSSFITSSHSTLKIKSSTIRVYIHEFNFFIKLSMGAQYPTLASRLNYIFHDFIVYSLFVFVYSYCLSLLFLSAC